MLRKVSVVVVKFQSLLLYKLEDFSLNWCFMSKSLEIVISIDVLACTVSEKPFLRRLHFSEHNSMMTISS